MEANSHLDNCCYRKYCTKGKVWKSVYLTRTQGWKVRSWKVSCRLSGWGFWWSCKICFLKKSILREVEKCKMTELCSKEGMKYATVLWPETCYNCQCFANWYLTFNKRSTGSRYHCTCAGLRSVERTLTLRRTEYDAVNTLQYWT